MEDKAAGDVKINGIEQNSRVSSKEFIDEKNNCELLGTPGNSNYWWPSEVEEKLGSRQRWSFGSDISVEAVENIQSRLCCSPVDEFDSTVSSETEDLIVNNTDEGSEAYKPCVQISPACSPTIKNAICNITDKRLRKPHEVYTDDDELVDYSKRYTTDNFALLVDNKSIDLRAQQQQQQRRMGMNNINRPVSQKKSVSTRSKGGYNFGDYAETDLDQPTDYSLRYAEEDMYEEDEEDSRFYCSDQPEEDVVRTYYTEGTPSNFSTATSVSDLLTLESPREGDEAAYKHQQFLQDQKENVHEKSEKAAKDCKNRIRQKFASNAAKIPALEEPPREVGNHQLVHRKLEKTCTPPQSPAEVCDRSNKEGKAVSFIVEENNYAQETPLMFSRSSSLDSLSEFEQESIQDDRSSIVSDFSHRTSGAVSPSDLPDSPTQTVPPSPRRLERQSFSGLQQQEQPHLQRLAQPRRIERANVPSLQPPPPHQQRQLQHQSRLQAQPLPPTQSQLQPRALIGPVSRNPSGIKQTPNNDHMPVQEQHQHSQSDMRVPLLQRSPAQENQIPLQLNNRIVLMQRPQPEGQASLARRPQNDSSVPQHLKANTRMPVVQRQQTENRDPVMMQRPQMVRTASPVVQHQPLPREPQLPRHILERCISVFEDNLVRFKDESTQSKFSTAGSCLSSLTIDDEDDNVSIDNREIINRIAAIRVRSSAAGMHQAPCMQRQFDNKSADKVDDRQPQLNVLNRHPGHMNEGSHPSPSKEELQHYVNVENESYDYTTCYLNKEVNDNRHRDSSNEMWYHENDLKNEANNHRPSAKSPIWKHNGNDDIIYHLQKVHKVPEIVFVDTVHTYYTEDTPVFVSPYGSESNLSGLSSLSISDDDFGYDFIRDERSLRSPRVEEAERSNSRADSYGSEEDSSESEDEDKNSSVVARRRIDVSPFESQMNLNFSLLCIEEEDEEAAERETEAEERTNNETDKSYREESAASDDYYRRLSRNSDCSDDDDEEERQVLEQCIKSGVSKVTRRSLEPRPIP
ncbi:adenomatous polyposis coli homolog [Copidosoma floridanum]|uniref:adenomatous polyposis coli homolog n=1 Tax=Copidosoma floridanum TaxID=29053 RepID=UPI0006C99081|nr:adenomatous polyposis coli homolog [Copidosoma floridanum]